MESNGTAYGYGVVVVVVAVASVVVVVVVEAPTNRREEALSIVFKCE